MRRALLFAALAPLFSATTFATEGIVHSDVGRLLADTRAPVKVWVFFADKGLPTPAAERAALEAVLADIPARTLERRALRRTAAGLVDQRDLPVAPAYVDAVRELGLEVHAQSRWLNGLSTTVDAGHVSRLEALPFVRGIQLVNRSQPLAWTSSPAGGCFGTGGGFYGDTKSQTELNNIDQLHALGFTGAGVVVGVLDTGFVTTHDAFNEPGHSLSVLASYDFVNDDSDVGIEPGDDPSQHSHGTTILGTLAAYDPNDLVGAAYDADYILCKTEDITSEHQGEEDFYVAGLEFAELNGADVITSSLGYIDWYSQTDLDGLTAVTTQAVNLATANGVHCCTAAGNNGHDEDAGTSTLIAPSDSFDVLTAGAAEITGEVAWFSSDGPTADGRVKPELLAMGDVTASVDPFDDSGISCASGTSLSTPILAATVACLVEAHPDWGVATLRRQLIDSASYFGDPLPDPDRVYGWGLFDAAAAHTNPVPFAASELVPGAAGHFNGTEVIGATPGEVVFFLFGTLTAPFDLPGCPGTFFDVFPNVLFATAVVDAGGEASIGGNVGPGAVGLTVLAQGIEPVSCRVTGVVTTTF